MTNPGSTEGREGHGTAGSEALVRCVWECKVGARMLDIDLPDGADAPMRRAVQKAFVDITGTNPEFCFSGWGGKLDEAELSVVENRPPSAAHEADWRLRNAAPELLSIARRWAALDAGAWHADRHAFEKAELLADTRAAIALAEGR